MIESWKHKGLKRYFETGSISGINPEHGKKLKIILQRLNGAIRVEDMNTPGMRFHKLSAEFAGYYSVTVNKNWRVIFKFEGQNAMLVNYLDYH